MTTPKTHSGTPRGVRSRVILAAMLAPLSGCGMQGGAMLYMLGVGQGRKIEAQFKLSEGPILIFIDDVHERVDWPAANRHLFNELSQELLRNKAAKKIIPDETLDQLKQTVPDFPKKSCRELGELAGASQVIWIEAQDYLGEPDVFEASRAAYFSVTVKVVDPNQKSDRNLIRLWPASSDGQPVAVSLTGARVAEAKSKDGISKILAEKLAGEIAKLFYEHRADDFEKKDEYQ